MVHAKNYETVSTFVKVIQKKNWPLFSGHGVECKYLVLFSLHHVSIERMMNEEMAVIWFRRFTLWDGTSSSSLLSTRVSEPRPV